MEICIFDYKYKYQLTEKYGRVLRIASVVYRW